MSDNEDRFTVSLVVAAKLMGIKQSWARDLLTTRQRENPHRSIMTRGTKRGRWRVNAEELGKIIRESNSVQTEFLVDKVETLESDVGVLRRRISRFEQEKSQNIAP